MNQINSVDVFVSYQHESQAIVQKIVNALEQNRIKCWYAPRNIIAGSYAKSICEGIGKCKVFLLVLTEEASNSQHVLNEVELAYKRLDNGIIMMPFKITQEINNEEMNYYINRLQWIDAVNVPLENAIHDLLIKLKPLFGIDNNDSDIKPITRNSNAYFEYSDKVELKRLQFEGELLYNVETSIYDKLFFNQNDLNVLDINILNPDNQIKLLCRKEVKNYIGLCYDKDAIDTYNNLYGQENVKFYYLDLTDPYFDVILKEKMNENNIQKFDLINLSMVILDLKDPFRILQKLRRFLSPNGMFYIRDIDDGLNLYYPDDQKLFDKYFKLASSDRLAGFRYSGRQIYSYLIQLGAKDINIELNGLSNINMNFEQKEKFFCSYFTFLSHEYKKLCAEEPNNDSYQKANEWLINNMPDIEDQFFDNKFFFIGGYIILTVKF